MRVVNGTARIRLPRPLWYGAAAGMAVSLIGAGVFAGHSHKTVAPTRTPARLSQAQGTGLSIAYAVKTAQEGHTGDTVSDIEQAGRNARGWAVDHGGQRYRFVVQNNDVKWVVLYRGTVEPGFSVCRQNDLPMGWCGADPTVETPAARSKVLQ